MSVNRFLTNSPFNEGDYITPISLSVSSVDDLNEIELGDICQIQSCDGPTVTLLTEHGMEIKINTDVLINEFRLSNFTWND